MTKFSFYYFEMYEKIERIYIVAERENLSPLGGLMGTCIYSTKNYLNPVHVGQWFHFPRKPLPTLKRIKSYTDLLLLLLINPELELITRESSSEELDNIFNFSIHNIKEYLPYE